MEKGNKTILLQIIIKLAHAQFSCLASDSKNFKLIPHITTMHVTNHILYYYLIRKVMWLFVITVNWDPQVVLGVVQYK